MHSILKILLENSNDDLRNNNIQKHCKNITKCLCEWELELGRCICEMGFKSSHFYFIHNFVVDVDLCYFLLLLFL